MASPTQMTQEEAQAASKVIFDNISSRDPVLEKKGVDQINDFTRTTMREDGYFRRLMTMMPLTNDELNRVVETDKPIKIVDKEPSSPAAISIPFATLPTNLYIKGPRYKVSFERITTPRFTKDVDELRTWIMDIRQVLSDNSIKDMLAEEDGKFTRAINTALVGQGLTVPTSGVVQWQRIDGGISRDSLWDSLKVMPNTPSNIEVEKILVNQITIKDVCKFARNEQGGGLAEDIMKDGWTLQRYMGKDWYVTIKKGLVPTNSMFQFGNEKFIGKSYSLEDTTMYVKREAFFIEFYSYETIGAAIGHTGALARIDYR